MPPETTSEAIFTFEPFLPLWAIVLIGTALFAISCWMGRRDFHFAARPRMVWLLLLFRFSAISVLLWMLAGPTLMTVLRKYQKKSIAVLVDASASMGQVDMADGSGNVSRWMASYADSQGAKQLRAIDSAIATLLAAKHQLETFAKLPDTTKDATLARATISQVVNGISEGVGLIKSSGAHPLPADELMLGMTETAGTIESGPLKALKLKAGEFSRGKSLAGLERAEWLPEQIEQLSLSITQLQRLADRFIKAAEKQTTASSKGPVPDQLKRSRWDNATELIRSAEGGWLKELSEKVTVARYEFGDKVIPIGTSDADERDHPRTVKSLSASTELGTALQQLALDNTAHPLTAAILITDGGQNAGRDPREIAPSLAGTALHIVPIGNTKIERDVILHHTHAPKAVLQNDAVIVESTVSAYDCEKEKLQIELLEDDVVIDRQSLNITSEVFDSQVQMRWKASKLGKHALAVRVVPVKEERTDDNNSAKVDIQVMEETMRVLIADNFPRWETRYLINLFKRDDRISFDQLLFEPQRVAGEGVRSNFPDTLEEWSKYRIVILGDVLPSQLTAEHQKLLRDYVTENGGNLIIVAGKDAMPEAYLRGPLDGLLPVATGDRALSGSGRFYLHVADEASQSLATQIGETPAASQQIWREMSERTPIYSISLFSKPKPTAQSLIWAGRKQTGFDTGDALTRSFMTWHYVGGGRVVYLAAPLTYQLRYRQGDTFHHRFWGQLLRWVVARDLAEGSQTVRLSSDKQRYEVGEPVQVSAQLRQLDGKPVSGADLQVELLQRDKVIRDVPLKEDANRPGRYHAVLTELPAGPARFHLHGARVNELLAVEKYSRPIETTVNIDPSAVLELRNPLCNMSLLREIADASGGMIVPPTGLEAAMRQLNLEPETSETVSKEPLWNRWDLFWLFVACLSLEWAGRKYLGLS
ncbi:hypothetical protein ACXR0O_23215 [Verrucomicrobiota bacterium sgz303538]